jgi:predicted dehydrogenase
MADHRKGQRMTYQGALIGCGFFAENHLNAWKDIDGADIVALCDLDTDRLADAGKRFGIDRQVPDIATLWKAGDLDFVDIATTVGSHRALVTAAAPHVRTILCQKPFAETLSDAAAMVDAAANHGANLIVHENFRWQRAFVEMKALVDQGRIGALQFGHFSFRHGYDNYVNQPYLAEIKRFCIMDVGLHLFDLARHFFGDMAQLSCTTQRLNSIVRGEDAFSALLRAKSGATVLCDASFRSTYVPEPFPNTAAVIEGDSGTLALDRDYTLHIHDASGHDVQRVEPDVPRWGARPWHGVQDSVLRFQRHAAQVMTGKAAPQPSGRDNIETLKLALAAYDAAERGVTIDLETWAEDAP